MQLLEAEAEQFGVSTEELARQLNGSKTYINGIKASDIDLLELERDLKAGAARACGKCYDGVIYFKTF
jgi:hypothetical protein